jgi:hypothetical protein
VGLGPWPTPTQAHLHHLHGPRCVIPNRHHFTRRVQPNPQIRPACSLIPLHNSETERRCTHRPGPLAHVVEKGMGDSSAPMGGCHPHADQLALGRVT